MTTSQQHNQLALGKVPSSSSSNSAAATPSLFSQSGVGLLRTSGLAQVPAENHHGSSHLSSKLKTAPHGKKTKGRVKIKMEFIDNKLRRYTTFSKRKAGLMKKAYELSTLTGTEVMLLVASETGHVYTFATRKLQPMITSDAGKALIQTCLNSPDSTSGSDPNAQNNPLEHHIEFEESEMGNEDFDEGDFLDDDEDSSNGSPPPNVTRTQSTTSSFLDSNGSNSNQAYSATADYLTNNSEYSINSYYDLPVANKMHTGNGLDGSGFDPEDEASYSGNG